MYLFTDIMSNSVYTQDKSDSPSGGLSYSEMDVNNIQVLSDEDYIRYTDDISAASYTVNDMSSTNVYNIMESGDEIYFSDNDQEFMSEFLTTNSPDENMIASIPPQNTAIKSTIEKNQNGLNENGNYANEKDEIYYFENDPEFMSEFFTTNSLDEQMVASIPPQNIAIKSTIEKNEIGLNELEKESGNHANDIQQFIVPGAEKNDARNNTGNEITTELKKIYDSRMLQNMKNQNILNAQDHYEKNHQNEEQIQIDDLQTNKTFQGM